MARELVKALAWVLEFRSVPESVSASPLEQELVLRRELDLELRPLSESQS